MAEHAQFLAPAGVHHRVDPWHQGGERPHVQGGRRWPGAEVEEPVVMHQGLPDRGVDRDLPTCHPTPDRVELCGRGEREPPEGPGRRRRQGDRAAVDRDLRQRQRLGGDHALEMGDASDQRARELLVGVDEDVGRPQRLRQRARVGHRVRGGVVVRRRRAVGHRTAHGVGHCRVSLAGRGGAGGTGGHGHHHHRQRREDAQTHASANPRPHVSPLPGLLPRPIVGP